MKRTIITGAMVVTMNDRREILQPGYLGVEDNKIDYVGDSYPIGSQWTDALELDFTGCLAVPGFINAHTHAGITVMRGTADDRPLMEWLETKIWPMEAKMVPEDRYWAAKLAALEMIRGGVTCFCDMSPDSDRVAQAAIETGIRAVLSEVLLETQDNQHRNLHRAVDFIREWNEKQPDRIQFYLGPHALYTCSINYLEKVIAYAAELTAGIQIHLSETAPEVENCRKQFGGKSPVEVLDEIGLFRFPTIAAHCVYLASRDLDILADRKVTAAHNPSSNMKLAAGVMDVERLFNQNINVALGTDSAASNNNLSILNEMRMAALLQKVSKGNPSVLPAGQVLEMATRKGAVAVGMETRLGQLQPGFEADVVLIRTDRLHSSPLTDPVSHLVYSLRDDDVDTVFIAGERVLRKGEFVNIDVEEVIAKSKEIISRIRV